MMKSNLKQIRLQKGMSQEELAFKAGITCRYVGFLELGERNPSMEVAYKIADVLGVRVDDIFLPSNCTECTQDREVGNAN